MMDAPTWNSWLILDDSSGWRAATTDHRHVGAGSSRIGGTPKAEHPVGQLSIATAAENFTLFQSAAYLTAISHMSSSPYDVDMLKPAQVGVS